MKQSYQDCRIDKQETKTAARSVVNAYFEKNPNALKSIEVEDERNLPLKEFTAYPGSKRGLI